MKNGFKIIFHIDLNAFYTSCEQVEHQRLRNKPIAVGGTRNSNRGVLTTASYEARQFGVSSAMPVYKAKKLCPHLIIVPGNMELYREYSKKFFDFLKTYTTQIEVGSIDEGYLDVTELAKSKHPVELAKEIQTRLHEEIKLPCSIGIAPNKFLAKMASDMKKPLGITVLRRRDVPDMLWSMPIGKMYGIGKKTAPKLLNEEIKTIGDLANKENELKARKVLGNQYNHFYLNANGYGNSKIDLSRHSDYKSVGNSRTYSKNIVKKQEAYQKLDELSEMVSNRLIRKTYLAKTITVQIRYKDFETHTKSKTIEKHVNTKVELFKVIKRLFDELWNQNPIRLLGVSTSNIVEKSEYYEQLDLFSYEKHEEQEDVIKIINSINRKYGDKTIKRGIKKERKRNK
ncbi:DNA polymerase IV [Haloplasma contractile]|uniref:DNA polymerase IV n=1 Tax=Haloplasma contractile SSD-17B TaxID=1033810 RepID=U2E007_9MOLU|nr:DNA polymerase IV [Haloplasma contractile]ERJ13767.1 DNA polymerase IV 1 protein [Haloplasma contractile SSD-17B]